MAGKNTISWKPIAWIITPIAVIAAAYVIAKPGNQGQQSLVTEPTRSRVEVPAAAGEQEAASTVFFLLDASASFHNGSDQSRLIDAIPLIRKTAETWQSRG